MDIFGYYDEELFLQRKAEAERREKLQKEILEKWRKTAKSIQEENETMLQKEARREAVFIIEDAARTPDEYDEVTILWDGLDKIEGWRLAKSEPKRTEILTTGELTRLETVIPAPLKHTWWRQLLNGAFLDVIFDCPHEIQELTPSRPVYNSLVRLDEKQKEILYYLAIRLWTPQQIAAMRGQTDRNIRKVYGKMIDSMQQEIFPHLYRRYRLYWKLTVTQVAFVESHIEKHGKGELRAKIPKYVKDTLWRTEHEPFISANKRILGEIQCVCVPSGERWEFIHHACGNGPAHCIRPDERSRNSCSGCPERGAACDEAGRGKRITECHYAVCIKIWPSGIYVCYTYNS